MNWTRICRYPGFRVKRQKMTVIELASLNLPCLVVSREKHKCHSLF
jgi:hypothetical protein